MLRATEACTFHHLNSQKCAGREVREFFLAFWLPNLLRATTACNFSSLIAPDGSAPAALASLLFDLPGPQNIGKKHSVLRLFYLYAHLHLLSSDSFSFLSFFLLAVSSLTLPTSAFSFVHIVGSWTSKLPSESVLWKTITFNRYCNSVCELGHLRQFADC